MQARKISIAFDVDDGRVGERPELDIEESDGGCGHDEKLALAAEAEELAGGQSDADVFGADTGPLSAAALGADDAKAR